MLSNVLAGACPTGQSGSSDYIPNGQPLLVTANHYHHQYPTSFELGRQPPQTSRPQNNVVNRSDDHTATDNMANPHWYQPPQPAYNYVAPSNSREMRNKAEKQRRDRLNSFISELASLVPLVSRSSKRLDKTSILRLTATHLRLYQTLAHGKGVPEMKLPPHVDQFVLDQLICDQMGGFLLIVSPTGKIIFISHTVETILGHLQTDLMGQSLYTVTSPEDHDKLRIFLDCERENEQGWRKYFSIRVRRAGPKSETPQYESVRIMGVHRNLGAPKSTTSSTATNGSSGASTSSLQMSINTDILVFFVKLYRPQPLTDRLIIATKNEYVTRHLIDGRIIGCDQRISLVAGYMIDEVQGHNAFQYMHKDDVRFVMIALRQMYDKGESRGTSCYRLISSNGEFIYLRTFGFLEIDDQGIVESFVCVNVQVDENEGLHHILNMRRRYSALFTSSLASLPSEGAVEDQSSPKNVADEWPSPAVVVEKTDGTEDPDMLAVAVNELMQNLPSPGSTAEAEQQSAQAHSPPANNSTCPVPSSTAKARSERTASKLPYLRIKSSGKRTSSISSPDDTADVKRQRLASVDSDETPILPFN